LSNLLRPLPHPRPAHRRSPGRDRAHQVPRGRAEGQEGPVAPLHLRCRACARQGHRRPRRLAKPPRQAR